MNATLSRIFLPPSSSSCSIGKARDGIFSFSLLMAGVGLLLVCRIFGSTSIRHWFSAVPLERPLDVMLLFAAVLLAMVLHECGHLLAAVLLGFRILGASIGPVTLQMLPGFRKFSWSLRTFFTGSVSAIPLSTNHWRAAMMTVVAAGPLTTLGTGLLAAELHGRGDIWMVFQSSLVQVSIVLFILGLIPNSRHARLHNDARLLMDLALGNDGAEETELKVLLKQQVVAGTRPQDYPTALMRRLAEWRGRPESQLVFAQAVVQWAIDSEEFELADRWDVWAVELSNANPGRMKNNVLAASACFDVIFRRDMEAARSKFAEVDCQTLFPACFEHRARAAQHVAWGRMRQAPGHILRAQYALPRGISYYDLERNLLERLHIQVLNAPAMQQQSRGASA